MLSLSYIDNPINPDTVRPPSTQAATRATGSYKTDTNHNGLLDTNDIVTWQKGTATEVAGLTFGAIVSEKSAFGSIGNAIAAACRGRHPSIWRRDTTTKSSTYRSR